MQYHHENRLIKIKSVLAEGHILGVKFFGTETFSQAFRFNVDVISTDKNLTAKQLLNTLLLVTIIQSDAPRYFHGSVTEFQQGRKEGGFYHYHLVMHPSLYSQRQTNNFRIFQNLSIPEIIKKILNEAKIVDFEFKLKSSYKNQEYCCQYNESNESFIHRLLSEVGIIYYYQHQADCHKLIFVDQVHSFLKAKENYKQETFFEKVHAKSCSLVLSDHQQKSQESESDYAKKMHVYPGNVATNEEAHSKMVLHREAYEVSKQQLSGSSSTMELVLGNFFSYQKGECYPFQINYSVEDGSYFSSGGQSIQVRWNALPMTVNYKSSIIKRPKVTGVELAVVVSDLQQEIDVDQYGRVRVCFQWSHDEGEYRNYSCYVPVMNGWAGLNYGMQFFPRVGEQVVVQFIHGDPNRPLIIGSVYQHEHVPPFTLPSQKTKSGIKTCSSPKGDKLSGNLLTFEDAIGKECIEMESVGKLNFSAKKEIKFQVGKTMMVMTEEGISFKAKKIKIAK